MRCAVPLLRAAGACLGVLAALGSAPVQGQTVSNIATARWTVGNEAFTVDSNEVAFEMATIPGHLTTYVALPGANERAMLSDWYCPATGEPIGTQPAAASGGDASTMVGLYPTSDLRAGQRLVVRLDVRAANRDAGQIDTLVVRLTTPEGDIEEIVALETGVDSGVFFGAIATASLPPARTVRDCRLSIRDGEDISITALTDGQPSAGLSARMHVLADPFGVVFSSRDGAPVDGAQVSIVDAATGRPAQVFAFDGVTPYPSTVTSGQPTADAGGIVHAVGPGEYRFPLLAFGTYRLVIEPPAPFTAPSVATPQELAALTGPGGRTFEIGPGSYGNPFAVDSVIPVEIDIPLDSEGGTISIRKRVSRDVAQPGDALLYEVTIRNLNSDISTDSITVTDRFSAGLRLSPGSVRVDGQDASVAVAADDDGRGFALALPPIAAGQVREIAYALTVAANARPGQVLNRAIARAGGEDPVEASVGVRIRADELADRMTLIGRVTGSGCGPPGEGVGVPGVRVMLEDGSFSITDADGYYHFDGLVPGTHVVRAIEATLPEGGRFLDCARSTRAAGSADSRFVTGQGGSLARVDFTAYVPVVDREPAEAEAGPAALTDQEASGAGTDWIALGDGPDEIVFPATGHNPRSPAIRVVVRHRPEQTPALKVDGRPVNSLAYEGTTVSPDKRYAMSVWRGVRLPDDTTLLTVTLNDASGAGVARLEREVGYANTPMRAELVRDRSRLIADGVGTPVLAVRLTDRHGRPVRAGISGSFTLESPYQALSEREARQSLALSGFGASSASWIVEGDDGIAYIELAPTMVSGALRTRFSFADGEISRETELEAWMEPGDQPWTLIGLAEGSIGARTVAENMERDGAAFDSDLGDNARVAFYAKGRVLGKYLLTIAYDSARQEEDQRLLGALDPAAYYTVYGDNTERLFDAASREKLYLRIEGRAFYAMFGDFETGFDQTELARYQRTATGVKSEVQAGQIQAQGFAAEISSRYQRDEIQGGGISGPYPLSSRNVLANSEKVAIEVRDRLRSELVLERRELVRFVDYDIDPIAGTITFSQPLLSRDPALNPQFAVIDYETDDLAEGEWNAGLRTTWTSESGNVRVGATAITDKGDDARTNLGAVDVRLRLGAATEVRAEAALSRADGESATAFSAEIEHHTGAIDVLAYARQVGDGFGVGQQNLAERSRRKFGADARVSLNEQLSVIGSAWRDESLTNATNRNAMEVRAAWRSPTTDAYLGLAYMDDHLADGRDRTSTVLEGGVTQRLFDQKLELSAASAIAIGGTESIDLPARNRLGARYAITPHVRAIGTYETAEGEAIDARTLQGGLELTPWRGSKVVTTLGSQSFSLDAQRTFAAFAIGQSLPISEALTLDATLDASRTLDGGIAVSDTVNPAHPVSSGGHLGEGGLLGEDFTAATLGAAYQKGLWSARVRGEYRDGELADRKGLTAAAIRQLGEGSVVGSGFNWTKASSTGGAVSEIKDASIALAHRPGGAELGFLSKIEFRSDRIANAVTGAAAPVGPNRLTVDGDARSSRLIGSVSANWTPRDDSGRERGELGVFVGMRHNFDRFGDLDLADTTLLGGADVRVAIGERIEIGGRATVRTSLDEGATSFALGPQIGFVPADDMLLTVGYNLVGFRDPDFSAARSTDRGLFAAFKVKFDEQSFAFLGLGER